ncbi:Extra-large guanine nucleotide-binding protein 1 [Linum perenne]
MEVDWSSSGTPTECATDIIQQPTFSYAAELVKKLHDLAAVHKKVYADLQDTSEENSFCLYGSTLQKDPNGSHPCSWSSADPSTFLICGETYLVISNCVLGDMGSMPEGTKYLNCIAYPIEELRRGDLGKCSRVLKRLLNDLELRQIMRAEKFCEANQLPPEYVCVNGVPLS